MSDNKPIRIKPISDFHKLRGLPGPKHPLISVINFDDMAEHAKTGKQSLLFDFYMISVKRDMNHKYSYGQNDYDFDQGVMFCMAPHQVLSVIRQEQGKNPSGWMLMIHPDFLWNTVGVLIYFFPGLYGDSYDALHEVLHESITAPNISFFFLLTIAMLKPLAASLTLGAGGDGGVFAPSIVSGAFLGLAVAFVGNAYFGANLIPLNFALVGAAATLSASLFAPLTSLVLICNLLPNGYLLFVPIMLGSVISYFFSKRLLPYNVYSYDFYLAERR